MAEPPLNQTFGIELEFICVYPTHIFDGLVDNIDNFARYGPPDSVCAGQALYVKLQKRGIPATGYEPLEEDINDAVAPYARWLVKEDQSLELSDGESNVVPNDWVVEPIEIASRKFALLDPSAPGEIKAVLEEIFALESMGCRMLTNHTTGFHVHVGNDDQLIPLKTAKRVFQLGTVFAPVMDRLHATTRIDPEHGQHLYLAPDYFHCNNGHNRDDANVFDYLESIEVVSTYADLRKLFVTSETRRGHSSAYNFDNLIVPEYGDERDITKTIEFRQHLGTLDYATIISWVALTTQVVKFCHNTPDAEFFAFLVHGVDPGTTIRDLCSGIGLHDDFVSYYTGERELPQAIPAAAQLRKDRSFRNVLDALDEINDAEHAELTNPELVKKVIQDKLAQGYYGTNTKVNVINHSLSAIEFHLADVASRFYFPPAERDSGVRVHFLRDLALVYSGWVREHGPPDMTIIFGVSSNVNRFDL